MENTETLNLCCGCLCAGRKMSLLKEFCDEKTFSLHFSDITESIILASKIMFCWECKNTIRKIISFKKQVKESFMKLQKCFEKSIDPYTIRKQPTLQTHHELSFDAEFINGIPPVKIEPESETEQKINIESPDHFDADDDVPLRKKKKRKKEPKVEVTFDLVYRKLELSLNEIEKERELLLLSDDYVNAMFRCNKCIKIFPNKDDYKDHISTKHEVISKRKCSICDCAYAAEMSYAYHMKRHKVRYECTVCSKRFTSVRSVTKHYEITHSQIPQDYSLDKTNNANIEKAETPEVENISVNEFICEMCNKSFRWKASLRKHLETHSIENGQKRRPYCEPCGLSFSTSSNLQKHMKLSVKHQLQLRLRKLSDSNLDASEHKAKRRQLESKLREGRELFACSQCDKKFQWRGNLARHVHSHLHRTKRDLVCEPCNRTFSSLATYKQHMKISKKHVSEVDFQHMCSDCGSKFASKTRLRDHINWEHLKNYVHTCELCQKVFKSHTSLYIHRQVVHKMNGTEHLCDHCGKAFANRTKLRAHSMAVHSGQSPYKCGVCSAHFSWHSCLSRHMRKAH